MDHIALQALRNVRDSYPAVFKLVERARSTFPAPYPKYMDHYTFAGGLMRDLLEHNPDRKAVDVQAEITQVEILASWNLTKGIYRFDPELLELVWNSEGLENIHTEVFQQMPEWCIFVETPGQTMMSPDRGELPIQGFFATVQNHKDMDVLCIKTILGGRFRGGSQIDFPLLPTFEQCVARAKQSSHIGGYNLSADQVEQVYRSLLGMINLVTYICTQVDDRPPARPLPQPKKVKGGVRTFAREERPVVWDVGIRTGPLLRKAREAFEREQGHSGHTVRPHFRRAHWRSVHLGPRNDPSKQRTEARFIMPTLVNAHLLEGELPAVVKGVPHAG